VPWAHDHQFEPRVVSAPHHCIELARAGVSVVVAGRSAAEADVDGVGLIDAIAFEIADNPPVILWDEPFGAETRSSLEAKLLALRERLPVQVEASIVPRTHLLRRGTPRELLRSAGVEGFRGSMIVHSSLGRGEIRLGDGAVFDAAFGPVEGRKALHRLFAQSNGTVTLVPNALDLVGRMSRDARALAEEITQELASIAQAEEALLDVHGVLLGVQGFLPEGMGPCVHAVATRLRMPATLDALKDDLPHEDLEILCAVLELDKSGRLRRLDQTDARAVVGITEKLPELRAHAARLRVQGFAQPARLVFAGSLGRVSTFGQAVLGLLDAVPRGADGGPQPLPRSAVLVRLGDDVSVEIALLPLVPAYAPIWPAALAGTAIVVRLDDTAPALLQAACESRGVPIVEANELQGGDADVQAPGRAAKLIRAALAYVPNTTGPAGA
jgi:hypothetical protein